MGQGDEEKSRSKERIISLRDENQSWNPKKQNPEIRNTYNNLVPKDFSTRVFPISNWTELTFGDIFILKILILLTSI